MAYPTKDWEIVKAFYEQGLSLAEILERPEVKATGISDRGSISKKAKQEGWIKGKNTTLATDEVQLKQTVAYIEEKKATLNATELRVHNSIVDERLRNIEFFNRAALKNVSSAVKKINENTTQIEHRLLADTILKGRVAVFGNSPDTVINNSNAQQTVMNLADLLRSIPDTNTHV